MIARVRHALRIGAGLIVIGLLTACARETTRTPAAVPPLAPNPNVPVSPAPNVPARGDLVHAVYFGYKSRSLPPEALRVIDDWVAFLKVHDGLSVSLTGHTDAVGSRTYNFTLARQRAIEVRRALVRGGIAKQRIRVRSRGAEEPRVYGNDEYASSRNRRVELEID